MMNRRTALRWAGAAGLVGLQGESPAPAQEPRKPHEQGIKLVDTVVRSRVGRQIDEIRTVAFSPDGSKVLTGGIPTRLMPVIDLMSLDGSGRPPRIITNAPNPVLRLWDALTGQLVQTFADHPAAILAAAFSPDASRVVSGGPARYVAADKELRANRERRAIVGGVKRAYVRWADYLVKVWDVASGKELHALSGPGGFASAVAFGRVVAAIDSHDVFRLWDPETGEPSHKTMDDFEDDSIQSLMGVSFSADGLKAMMIRWVIGEDHARLIWNQWDAAKGRARKWGTSTESAHGVALDPDGKLFATGTSKKIQLWDFESRKLVREFDTLGHSGGLNCFSPDGSLLVTSVGDDTVHVWDVGAGRRIASARGTERHSSTFASGQVRAVAFLPDGVVRVASGGRKVMLVKVEGIEDPQHDVDPETGSVKTEPLLVWDFKI